MKRVVPVALCGLLALLAAPALTQEKPVAKPAADKPATKAAADNQGPKGRLPNNYGKLDLTQAQREKIYGLQEDYRVKLDELVKQITAIKDQRDADIEAVLTPVQKKKLDELVAETKAKAEAKKKEVEAKRAADAAAAGTTDKPAATKPAETKPTTEKK